MNVMIYKGGLKMVEKSGVGQAIHHQEKMLEKAGIPVMDKWSEKAEIIHINTIFPNSLGAVLRARIQGKKVIYYGHSTMEDFRNSFCGSNALAGLFKHWIKFCYSKGDIIITPSAYSKKLLESYGIKKPIYSVSNGIDTDYFAPDEGRRQIFRLRYHIKPEEKVVISVGHYIERKGLPDFVEMARRMPDTKFMWFGYTDRRLIPEDIKQAMDSAPDNLVFPGYIDQEQLCDAYCGADLFAFLSKEETEGIVVLEALSCEIPVLVRNIPVYQGWLQDGENVYKACDLEGFCQKAEGILNGSLPVLTSNGRRTALGRGLYVVGEQMKKIYYRLLPQEAPQEAVCRKENFLFP